MKISSIIVLLFIFSLASCSQKKIELKTVLNSNICGITQEQLVIINSDKELNQLFNPLSFNNPITNLPSINFDQSSLILIAMGSQSTAGFSIKLLSPIATIEYDTLQINAEFTKPSAGSLNAQVLTSPCALYLINKNAINAVTISH